MDKKTFLMEGLFSLQNSQNIYNKSYSISFTFMFKLLSLIIGLLIISSTSVVAAQSSSTSSYYRSAKSGQFTTKAYSYKNPSTTMRQSRR